MSDEQEKQEKKSRLTQLIALLTAIAAVLGAIGFNQFFPDIVKRYFFPSTSQSSPSIAPPVSTTTPSSPTPPSPDLSPEKQESSASQTIAWNTTADDHKSQIDQNFTYNCPPNGQIGRAWGTDTYTFDSSICTAAVHAGLITAKDGGVVKIKIRLGASSYISTTRNGVTTAGYGSYTGSFVFIDRAASSPVSDPSTQTINWSTTAADHLGQLNQEFRYRCLPDGQLTGVWGTDTYTFDSSICTAAVHAGLITAKDGGVVKIKIRPGASSYISTTRNGVTTAGYGSYTGSFVFVN